MGKLWVAALSALVLAHNASALEPIIMKGTKFFYTNGTQFFMKGIAYQQDTAAAGGESVTGEYKDPLAEEAACRHDIPILVEAGTNTIRTYAIDPKNDHSACMEMLSDAGIYVVSDLGEPKLSINRETPQWNTELYDRYTSVIDALAQYDNTIGFFAGNEVSNDKSNTEASVFVKAAVRDAKKHIKEKGYRWMGVGYAANDDKDIRANSARYFNCGDQDAAIDFWGYNIYSWCGENTLNYSVPVFFAEYGCNQPSGGDDRIFQETTALYEREMTDAFSGGIVYMYHQEANDFGLVEIKDGQAEAMKNYYELASRVLNANPTAIQMDSYEPSNTPAECSNTASNWEVQGDTLPPTPDKYLCECMVKSLSCIPKSNLEAEAIGDIFGYVCGASSDSCEGINTDPSTGVYGAFSMCSDEQKFAYVMNDYYKAQRSTRAACDYEGQGEIVSPSADDTCKKALASVADTTSASSTARPSSSSTGNAAAGPHQPVFNLGGFAIGAYLIASGCVGAAIIAL
ncbi:glycolipid anchored surface protein [Colletotrichum graminicola]|uniref:1,3-beta-glucanosyltransferase n=1 Tax=Colletotrichum graminicola (strain M1.001 / M2 / FGSC 10212) TaxID=645133 RepID=E3QHH2_COLGM|nr:glycolipid anchored surface protein [Colletotrichum graminicola M1.001]EFQ30334.1 glycolipid anchored surface protein [Colletotrichum graminicola M1.001]WDK08960.1 glycolipid anchored surface protein [Colletotrichum graminicola]